MIPISSPFATEAAREMIRLVDEANESLSAAEALAAAWEQASARDREEVAETFGLRVDDMSAWARGRAGHLRWQADFNRRRAEMEAAGEKWAPWKD